ncbi:kinesin-like protein KIF14 [Toxorhynchites rutilus septentrionalis]|uniref:kinesin-like protein KIF14 n=1 Tax=Toxorhynchites rutilus septentrionalis TaxID=329112 RepID=UPI0024799444|nr:kinesin-like protein KIF14 [Toxorhynchites rutilus septentrionalis]
MLTDRARLEMNSRVATPKVGRLGSSSKQSTPMGGSQPVRTTMSSSLLSANKISGNTPSSDVQNSAPSSALKTPKSHPTAIFANAKSKSSTALNSCMTPSSLFRGTASATSLKNSGSTFGTPKYGLKKTKSQLESLAAKTPECFSKVSLESPRVGRNSSKLDDSAKSLKEKDGASGEISNLKVAVRVRPLSTKECLDSVANIVQVRGNEVIVNAGSTADAMGGVEHCFQYDHAFWSCNAEDQKQYVDQIGVHDGVMKPLLDKAFEGYNVCLFAYGQTGSGKSYSMMGMDADDLEISPEAGIIPRFCQDLFRRIESCQGQIHAEVEVSYFEIYNEKIHDLLAVSPTEGVFSVTTSSVRKPPLKVREHPIWGPYVVDLSTHPVDSYSALRNWLAVGNSQRATAATGMNDKSSRSHSIFSVVLNLSEVASSENKDTKNIPQTKRSKISLVDLAGSERVSHTCASGSRLKEGVSINKSLLTLGKVISSLADSKKNPATYIPYRDSVLTWLLRENLGGNSRTVMLATISPAATHLDETLATLRYACQARTIVNRVKVNEDPHDRIIRELRAEVERLQVLRQDYERQKRHSANQQQQQLPRKIIIETSVDDGEVEALRQQLAETEQELAKAQKSWRQRLQEAEDVRRTEMKLLRRKGLALELSAEQKEPCLVNLAADPMLSGTLLYIIPAGVVKIGRPSSFSSPDIVLEGPLVSHHHCSIENKNGKLHITPEDSDQYETFVNGELVRERRQLFHNDRVVIGGSHYFRVSNPLCPKRSKQIMVDFQLAHQEILREQENRLRRELDAEKQAAISRIEAERMAHERQYEERLASLELEKFKYKCHKELLETEKEAMLKQSTDDERNSSFEFTPFKSNLADEIRMIMERPSEESLHQIQLMVKEATQRCRDLGIEYEFQQSQVLDEQGIFRAVVNIFDKANGNVAEWLPARLQYWLGVVRDREDLNATNMFETFDLEWKADIGDFNHSLNESRNSSRISLNLSSVKDVIMGRNNSTRKSVPPNSSVKQQGLLKSMFKSMTPNNNNIRKELFVDDEPDQCDENVPDNKQSPSPTKFPRFEMKAQNQLKDIQVATLKLKKLCEKQQRKNAKQPDDADTSNLNSSVRTEDGMVRDFLRSIAEIENAVQDMRFILTEQSMKQATAAELAKTPKSVRFLLD